MNLNNKELNILKADKKISKFAKSNSNSPYIEINNFEDDKLEEEILAEEEEN
jgi:hypothetical protein